MIASRFPWDQWFSLVSLPCYNYIVKIYVLPMTSSNSNIFQITGPLWGYPWWLVDSPHKGPVTWSFDVFFDLCLNVIVLIMTSLYCNKITHLLWYDISWSTHFSHPNRQNLSKSLDVLHYQFMKKHLGWWWFKCNVQSFKVGNGSGLDKAINYGCWDTDNRLWSSHNGSNGASIKIICLYYGAVICL